MTVALKHLRLVDEVSRQGTLTGAARRLYVTQSALSYQLADLERRVGGPVFARVGKRMVPTAAGQRILEAARTTLAALDELDADLRGIAEGRLGRLHVTTKCYTAYHWLPAVLPAFRSAYPGVDFRIVPEAAARPIEALLDGEVDLALAYDVSVDEGFYAMPLFEDEQVLIVAPDHPLAERAFAGAQDLAGLDLLVYRDDGSGLVFDRVLKPAGVTPRSVSEVRITEGIVALVSAGLGAAVVTRWSVAPDIRQGRVAAVRVTEFGLRRQWYAVGLPDAGDRPYLVDFVALLQRGPNWLLDTPEHRPDLPFAGVRAPLPTPLRRAGAN